MSVLKTAFRVLTFRASREELRGLDAGHLAFGLVCTWIVGMGRYWDDPGAVTAQKLGVGSVVYVFALSLLLWAVMKPLRPKDWHYWQVLTFVTLTAPPALLYAIPVERFTPLETAISLNVWFLAVVALWRVALLIRYGRVLGQLTWPRLFIGAFLPLAAIVTTLATLNLERAVFEIMGGLREPTANDGAFGVVSILSLLSALLIGPMLVAYAAMIWVAWKKK